MILGRKFASMDEKVFREENVQRVYQYLKRMKLKQDLDKLKVNQSSKPEGSKQECLDYLLEYVHALLIKKYDLFICAGMCCLKEMITLLGQILGTLFAFLILICMIVRDLHTAMYLNLKDSKALLLSFLS